MSQVENLMKALGVSKEEALQIIADDNDIDQGKPKDFDLTKEQEKNAKHYRQTHQKKKSGKPVKRERKPNVYKADLVQYLYECMCDYADANSVQIDNKERSLCFKNSQNVEFSVTLVQHRAKKS
jgi:hypothetical protein